MTGDWRWSVLLGLSLLVIMGEVLSRDREDTRRPVETCLPPNSWLEMGLRWENDGGQGQGVYSCQGGSQPWAKMGNATGLDGLVEPRLAVFAYQPFDLNRVDYDTLRVIKGVGPKMAAAIIAYRQTRGPFRNIEELLAVKGIGPAKFKALRDTLVVYGPNDFSPDREPAGKQ